VRAAVGAAIQAVVGLGEDDAGMHRARRDGVDRRRRGQRQPVPDGANVAPPSWLTCMPPV
jgi:hypothetical protein